MHDGAFVLGVQLVAPMFQTYVIPRLVPILDPYWVAMRMDTILQMAAIVYRKHSFTAVT